MTETGRRFTDREVALVLKKATELDESSGMGTASGLSLEELTEVAGEVGISEAAIRQAVAGLGTEGELLPSLKGAPLVRKALHAVPKQLNEEAIARLVRLIDERTDSAGAVTEALGSVRWTTSDRFKSTRVSITPRDGETSIEVVEQFVPRLRRVFQLLPAAWSVMIGSAVLGRGGDLSALGIAAGVGLALVAGAGIGRFAWSRVSAQSEGRVRKLAESLALEAGLASAPELPAGKSK